MDEKNKPADGGFIFIQENDLFKNYASFSEQ